MAAQAVPTSRKHWATPCTLQVTCLGRACTVSDSFTTCTAPPPPCCTLCCFCRLGSALTLQNCSLLPELCADFACLLPGSAWTCNTCSLSSWHLLISAYTQDRSCCAGREVSHACCYKLHRSAHRQRTHSAGLQSRIAEQKCRAVSVSKTDEND